MLVTCEPAMLAASYLVLHLKTLLLRKLHKRSEEIPSTFGFLKITHNLKIPWAFRNSSNVLECHLMSSWISLPVIWLFLPRQVSLRNASLAPSEITAL